MLFQIIFQDDELSTESAIVDYLKSIGLDRVDIKELKEGGYIPLT